MRFQLIFIAFFLLTGCSPERFFYYPNTVLYNNPDRWNTDYEIVHYPSLNGNTLYGLYFKAKNGPPIGTVVHCHGNYGNISNHFPLSLFLTREGFDVLIFDYEGYGGSQGTPKASRLVEDVIATVRYANAHQRPGSRGVVLFGQSLGASIAIVAAAQEPLVKGVVAEAPFRGYRPMARTVLGRHLWLWPLYPIYPLFLSNKWDAERWVGQIAPKPLFLLHGDHDSIVPVTMAPTLFEKAKEPKTLWIIPNAGHLKLRSDEVKSYEQRITDFFKSCLK